jgi:hypothetical protein
MAVYVRVRCVHVGRNTRNALVILRGMRYSECMATSAAPKDYRVRQYDSVLNTYTTLRQAAAYLDICTIDGIPARQAAAYIEKAIRDYDGWVMEWGRVETAPRHLHHMKTGWKVCYRAH